ncbi:sodium:proton antiporter [Endozoicomonas gorgoniicola]|uniref:Sodium:proton antiporter n=1 Tax=Endozoicomonas gorgoniicola TaxID=1234144 RepID=A0ABT3MY13_9GAMM|nr:sodium:proton antiporter [Endozoicomonas gorgoniicola]MCW7554269.1 sodium:proton antiporter [Endozoicomonas gorgoniicola]
MHAASLAIPVLILSGLLLIATSSAILLKRLRFPYTIGLVVIGMVLGIAAQYADQLELALKVDLSHDLIMYVLLPILIFDAAINIKPPSLFREMGVILNLAVIGVVLSMLVVGALLNWLTPLSLASAMLFGALISATDPVAVIALFKEVGAPERLSMLMDSESLFNDASAIVIFGIVLAVVQSGSGVSAGVLLEGIGAFIKVFFGGILVGSAMGVAMRWLMKLSKGVPFAQIAFTTILAYGSFIIADHVLGVSGVMSTIAAGIITRSSSSTVLSEEVRGFLRPYWELLSFIVNSLIFLLLGLKENLLFRNFDYLLTNYHFFLVAIFAVLAGRLAAVYLLLPASNRLAFCRSVDGKSMAVMFWGGLRGVVPVALMLLIPDTLPDKELIIDLTLVVILFSLLIQGTTVNWLMKKLNVCQQYHIRRAAMKKLGA